MAESTGDRRVQAPTDLIFVEQGTSPRTARRRRAGSSSKGKNDEPSRNLLRHETVLMTVLAQDPSVADGGLPLTAPIPVPADRLQRGPRNHRFHVVDVGVGTNRAGDPVKLHDEDPWTYTDRWAAPEMAARLPGDREFRAQNVFAVAAHTLALFERHLGRPIPWQSGWPHLYLLPEAKLEGNASYSRTHSGVLFGWLPQVGELPAVYTSLSYDVIAHEVSHAILDGLRPRYIEPGLPYQRAFHEALADLVALFSVFDLKGVAEKLLDPSGKGTITFPSDAIAAGEADPDTQAKRLREGRAEFLKETPLLGLAEQLGVRRARRSSPVGDAEDQHEVSTALRRSVSIIPGKAWIGDPRFDRPHRMGEVLVAAFMQTFVTMWVDRLRPLRAEGGMDVGRVAEEGRKSARHLLAMMLRALDYLPPVELEFGDVIDSVITADKRLAPNDDHNYREALEASFAAFGITAPPHQILDEDGMAAEPANPTARKASGSSDPAPPVADARLAAYPPDPDADTQALGIRYEHLNLLALRTSPEEVYQFIWSNATALGIDVRFSTRVERVIASTRVGPDGLIVTEILADYTQKLETTAGNLPPPMSAPAGMDPDDDVELWGGGVLVFDQFGRFRLHQRKPLLDVDRQSRRLHYLFRHGLRDRRGGWGKSDMLRESQPFALLHEASDDAW
jgi:hypothetical protein